MWGARGPGHRWAVQEILWIITVDSIDYNLIITNPPNLATDNSAQVWRKCPIETKNNFSSIAATDIVIA